MCKRIGIHKMNILKEFLQVFFIEYIWHFWIVGIYEVIRDFIRGDIKWE